MNGRASSTKAVFFRMAVLALAPTAFCLAAGPEAQAPARVFFSDAHLSFTFPDGWRLGASFPYGPVFERPAAPGEAARISCEASKPLDETRLASDADPAFLLRFAAGDLASRRPAAKILSGAARQVAGQNAYELHWEEPERALFCQSDYFFVENRVYALTLAVSSGSFAARAPEFQAWLDGVRVLSRRDSGALDSAARGGVWVHQTGGAKIAVPDNWLIAVADDRELGATLAHAGLRSDFTVTVDPAPPAAADFTTDEKDEARRVLQKKGYKILSESEEPFHDLPAFRLDYEGLNKDREVRGQDLWVASPRARWLFNMEGDASLFVQLADNYRSILNNVQFL